MGFVAAVAFVSMLACDVEVGRVGAPILGGAPARGEEIFGTVAVHADGEVCGGVLVAPEVVVTAAHCLAPLGADLTPMPVTPPDRIRVLAGVLTWDAATAATTYAVRRAEVHPDWPTLDLMPPSGLGRHHDLAVLVLERPADTVEVMPILAADRIEAEVVPDAVAIITGYGWRAADPTDEGTLYLARTPVTDRSTHEVLLGAAGEPDACSGDSGSPSYLDAPEGPVVIGVASRGRLDRTVDCGEGGIYTLVPAYREWIAATGGVDLPGDPPVAVGDGGGCAVGVAGAGRPSLLFAAVALGLVAGRRRRRGGRWRRLRRGAAGASRSPRSPAPPR